jgi:hypothetical protein
MTPGHVRLFQRAVRLGQGVKAIGKLADCVVWDTRPLITTTSQEIVLHMRNSVI